jgi:hypothetical protein
MLADKYRNQGFEISRFGASSTALKRFNKVVYVFDRGIQEDQKFIDALCDCHLKITRRQYAEPERLNYPAFCSAGFTA